MSPLSHKQIGNRLGRSSTSELIAIFEAMPHTEMLRIYDMLNERIYGKGWPDISCPDCSWTWTNTPADLEHGCDTCCKAHNVEGC